MTKFPPISVHDLGDYLREQRHSAELSLRQLSEVAGISNPYLSQIERGLKKPSAEILSALAKALRISAESLYVRAGFLEEHTGLGAPATVDVQAAVLADPALSNRQRAVLLDVYESFVGEPAPNKAPRARRSAKAADATNATDATDATDATNTTKAAEATRPTRPTKPRPAKTPARHSPDPAMNTTKEN
ncbi:MAG TPA: helix-turn-helix domain-containing protein [Dermatophilaceae bacterium]|nr:helix-turn-helix domain-containing protein [Dermatophilaceae bacterium]